MGDAISTEARAFYNLHASGNSSAAWHALSFLAPDINLYVMLSRCACACVRSVPPACVRSARLRASCLCACTRVQHGSALAVTRSGVWARLASSHGSARPARAQGCACVRPLTLQASTHKTKPAVHARTRTHTHTYAQRPGPSLGCVRGAVKASGYFALR